MNNVSVKVRKSFICIDCGFDTLDGLEYYMVGNRLWENAGMTKGMLCIGCLEDRIGHKLRSRDFPNYPINRGSFPASARLLSRLLAK